MTPPEPSNDEPAQVDIHDAEPTYKPLDINDLPEHLQTSTPEAKEAALKELSETLRASTASWRQSLNLGTGSIANAQAFNMANYGAQRFQLPNPLKDTIDRINASTNAFNQAQIATVTSPGNRVVKQFLDANQTRLNTQIANVLPRTEAPKFNFGLDQLRTTALANPSYLRSTFPDLTRITTANTALFKGLYAPAFNFDVTEHLTSLFSIDLTPLTRFVERFKPRNLRDIDIEVSVVLDVMREEAIPFALVPDPETATLLAEAPDKTARKKILVQRSEAIFDACDDVIALCVKQGLPEKGSLIRAAINAYNDGHHEAAQTLATVILDGLVSQHPNKGQLKSAVDGHAYIEDAYGYRDAIFLLPIPTVHIKTYTDEYKKSDGSTYNRNATVHTASGGQLSSSNAVQAIMLASSLLGFYQDLW